MIFGQPEEFAIEAEVSDRDGKWLFGHLGFFVGGLSVGEMTQTSDLAGSARAGRVLLRASRRRTRPDLDGLEASLAFDQVYGRYVVPVVGPVMDGLAGQWDRDPYLLDDLGESSLRDKFAVILLRRADGADRVVVKQYSDEHIWERVVRPGVCDGAIESYCGWIEGVLNQ